MSKADKRQLVVIYSLLAFVVVLSVFVVNGVFGSPKYTKDTESTPNWFTESNLHDDYDPVIPMQGSVEQSSSVDANLRLDGGYNLSNYGHTERDGVVQDKQSTTGIPSF